MCQHFSGLLLLARMLWVSPLASIPHFVAQRAEEWMMLAVFRRAYFPKDCVEEPGEIDTVDAVGRELANKSAILVKSAFALH
jgi:hypothetical protein